MSSTCDSSSRPQRVVARLACSSWGWRNGAKLSNNIPICVLGIAFGVFLWTVMVLPLFEVSVSANNLDDFEGLLLYMVLYGATPLAAFPALFLFGPGKKSSDAK